MNVALETLDGVIASLRRELDELLHLRELLALATVETEGDDFSDEKLITPQTAADVFHLSESQIRRLCGDQRLGLGTKRGGRVFMSYPRARAYFNK